MVFKLLCCLVILFMGGNMDLEILSQNFNNSSFIIVTIDNKETCLNKGEDKYELVLKALENVVDKAKEMPAFGVSLDKETREQKQTGKWIELVFEGVQSHNDMPYESLLIEVQKDWQGFNIIRKNNGKYDGRCFYLELEGNMEPLYNAISELSVNE